MVNETSGESAVADGPATVAVEVDIEKQIRRLEKEMLQAAKNLEFEHAADLRDAIAYLKKREIGLAS